jgi:hypothetical protein
MWVEQDSFIYSKPVSSEKDRIRCWPSGSADPLEMLQCFSGSGTVQRGMGPCRWVHWGRQTFGHAQPLKQWLYHHSEVVSCSLAVLECLKRSCSSCIYLLLLLCKIVLLISPSVLFCLVITLLTLAFPSSDTRITQFNKLDSWTLSFYRDYREKSNVRSMMHKNCGSIESQHMLKIFVLFSFAIFQCPF